MKKQRIGVIGSGAWGKNIVRVFHELGALGAICDQDPASLKEASQKYPDAKIYSQAAQLMEDSSITAVAIAATSSAHYPLGRAALLAGKDVYVEKPMALSFSQGLELTQLAERQHKILMVGHILEYHPAVKALEQLIQSGELGDLFYIYSSRLNLGRVRQEENILWSFAPHDIAVILRLLGHMPLFVSCTGGNYLSPNVADVTLTSLTFPNGVRGHLFVSWLHPYKEQKLIVVGSKKMAVFDDVAKEGKLKLLDGHIDWVEGKPKTTQGAEKVIAFSPDEPLTLELQHFLKCLDTREEPVTSGKRALSVLKVLEASQHSLSLGGDPVSLESASSVIPDPTLRGRPQAEESDQMSFPDPVPIGGVGRKRESTNEESASNAQNNRYFIHPTAIIDPQTKIGKDTKIWHFCHMAGSSEIGAGCVLGQNVYIGPGVKIGNNVKIQNNVSIYEKVILEDDVFCGPSCVFTNVMTPRSHVSRKNEFLGTVVKRGATVGANATIVCGVTLGEYAFVGAGAVVTKDVPAYALVHGNPARLQGWMCRCGEKLAGMEARGEHTCSRCRTTYLVAASGLKNLSSVTP